MSAVLTPLLQLQRFFIPALLILLLIAIWRVVFRKDYAVGLALYVTLVVIVDSFFNTGIFIPGIPVGSIRFSEICAAVLLLLPARRADKASAFGIAPMLVALYFFLMLVSAVRAEPISAGIFDFRRIIVPQVIAFILARRGLHDAADYKRFLLWMTPLVMTVGLFCFWDVFFDRWILHSDMLLKPEYTHNRRIQRYGSILLNPNFLGAFVVLLFPPFFALTLATKQRKVRLLLIVVLLALIFCLVETQSRGPLAAFAGTLALLLFAPVSQFSRMRRLGALVGGIVLLSVFMPGFFEHASTRFESQGYEETEDEVSRSTVWLYTRRLIADHPLGGIGFGEQQFLNEMGKTDFELRYGGRSLDNPHNSYLQAAIYAGLPAVVLFLLANLSLLTRALRAVRRDAGTSNSGLIFGFAVGITGFLVCILPDMHLFTPNIGPLYWAYFGILLSLVPKSVLASSSNSFGENVSEHWRAQFKEKVPQIERKEA